MPETLLFQTKGGFQFQGGEGDDVRNFSVILAACDVPMPLTPSGGQDGARYIVPVEAARAYAATLNERPIRIAATGRSHYEEDGRLARVYGHFKNVYVTEAEVDGQTRTVIRGDGVYYANEDPTITQFISANASEFGGSFEIYQTGEWPRVGNEVTVAHFRGTGAAILERRSAAYQQLTKLVAFQAKDTGSESGGSSDEVTDEVAESGRGESMDEKAILALMEGKAAELAELSAKCKSFETDLAAALQAQEANKTLLAQHGVDSVTALVEKFVGELKVAADKLAEANTKVESLVAEKAVLDEKLRDAETEAIFAGVKDRYDEKVLDRIKLICGKQVAGEPMTAEDMDLWASIKAQSVEPPNGDPKAHGEPSAESELGSVDFVQLCAEAKGSGDLFVAGDDAAKSAALKLLRGLQGE